MRSRTRTGARKRGRGRPAGGSETVIGAILDATLALLAARGYSALRIEDVATRAGVNKTSVYRRWPAKSDLVIAALREMNERDAPAPDTGSLHADIVEMMHQLRSMLSSPEGAGIVRALMATDDPGVTKVARSLWDRLYATPSPVFERAIARGDIPPDTDTALFRELIAAPISHRLFLLREPVDDAFLTRLAASVLRGIGVGGRRGEPPASAAPRSAGAPRAAASGRPKRPRR